MVGRAWLSGVVALGVGLAAAGCGDRQRAIEVDVLCSLPRPPGPVTALAPGVEFQYTLDDALTDERIEAALADDLDPAEWIDAPGFVLHAPTEDEGGRLLLLATAPSEPGQYTWTVKSGSPVEFLVYDPDQAVPTLRDLGVKYNEGQRKVSLSLSIGETFICEHGRDEIARVSALGDGCEIVMKGVEIVTPFQVAFGPVSFGLELFSDGPCQLTAELAPDRMTAKEFEPAPRPVEEFVPPERELTDVPELLVHSIGPGSTCPSTAVDGDCSFPYYDDGDCYWDAEWRIRHVDPLEPEAEPLTNGDAVGIGLTTRLNLGISVETPSIPLGPPGPVTFEQPSGGLWVEPLECEGDYRLVAVQGWDEGEHDIEFRSANTEEVGEFTLPVRPVAQIDLAFESETGSSPPGEADVDIFVRNQATVSASYRDADGIKLVGIAPLEVSADMTNTMTGVVNPDTLIAGQSPHTLSITSTSLNSVPGSTLQVNVRDESAIASIGGAEQRTLAIGQDSCVRIEKLHPLGAGERTIHGRPPVGPRLAVSGILAFSGPLCLRGLAAGEATLSWTWAGASVESQWMVTP